MLNCARFANIVGQFVAVVSVLFISAFDEVTRVGGVCIIDSGSNR